MPRRDGTFQHYWFVMVQLREHEWDYKTFHDEPEAWEEYRRVLAKGDFTPKYGEMYIFVPREKKNV